MKDIVRLEELELYKDCGGYFLKAKYTVENESKIQELRFPRIRFEVHPHELNMRHEDNIMYIDMGLLSTDFVIDSGLDVKTGRSVKLITEIIEEKTKEMTIAEIEKKLGHKIKIVGED